MCFKTKIFILILLISGCNVSKHQDNPEFEFVGCKWKIPDTFEENGNLRDSRFQFMEKTKLYKPQFTTRYISFARAKASKESFERLRNKYASFRSAESEEYYLVQFNIDDSEDKGNEQNKELDTTFLLEKQSGNYVMLADLNISDFISNCYIPIIPDNRNT